MIAYVIAAFLGCLAMVVGAFAYLFMVASNGNGKSAPRESDFDD